MKLSIHTNSQMIYSQIQNKSRVNKFSFKGIKAKLLRISAFALLLWLPVVVSAQLTLPAIPSNSNLASRFDLSTEMVFRVKVGSTYLPSGALIAYINGEIRGAQTASVLYPPTGVNVYKVMVFDSKTSGDTIVFKYYDTFSGKIYDINEKIQFVPDQIPDYANPVILTAYCKPIDKVTGLLPENGTEKLNSTLDLYWQPSPNTTSYSLYLWEDGAAVPSSPTNINIYGTTFRLYNLKYGQVYRWKIGSVNDCSSAESGVQTFKVRQLPDLTVTNVTAPANIESGNNFAISFKINNIGGGSTAGAAWSDAVYVSTDQTLSGDDKLLSTTNNVKQLEADSSYIQTVTVSLPIDYSGNYYFIVKTDLSNTVYELLEDNNLGKTTVSTHVTLKPLPDIRVKDILAGPATVNPGDSLTISWNVENIGGVPAIGGWSERITLVPVSGLKLSIDPNVDYLLPLPAGTTIARSRKIKLPDVLRFSGEANIQVELIPYPDLQEYTANKANNIGLSAGKITVGNILALDIQETTILENASAPVRCIITRSGDYSASLLVSLSASVAGQVTIPATVIIPANQSSLLFNLNTINNTLVDGQRNVWITASAVQYTNIAKTITILDDEIPSLTASFNTSTAAEGDTLTLTVSRNLVTNLPLVVNLSTNKSSQWTFPVTLVIPANIASANVRVNVTDDNIPELTNDAVLYTSSAGFTTSQVTASITDNDVPQVSLELLADTVSEGAGVYATWGILKRIKGDGIITVNLTASLPDALFFPASLTLPKGTQEQKFNIGVVDNAIVDGYRKVTLSGSVFISSCNCNTSAQNGGIVTANLVIADNDGPSLTVTVNPVSLPEGKFNAGTLTISRNTPTDKDLKVSISHDYPTKVSIQTSATILTGQTSVQVPINTINDNIPNGNQMVSVQASASTFSSGFGYVFVTDINKPDLVIDSISLSNSSPSTNDVIEIKGTAGNIGFASASSGMKISFYSSKDNTLDASDILMGDYTFTSPIDTNTKVNFTKSVVVPGETGNLFILAKINPTESVIELVYFNNVSKAVPINISPEYSATAVADSAIYMPGSTVRIHGSALNSINSSVANADVDVYILTAGTRRELKAKTNLLGEYTLDFVPNSYESGHYIIGACYPKQNLSVEQDKFDIPGISRETNAKIIWDTKLGQTITGKIAIKNTSEATLKAISISSDKLPAGCQLTFDTIAVLSANQTREFNYTLKSTALTKGTNYEKILFHVQSAEGISLDFPAFYYCQALQAQLKADPVSLNTTLTKGKPRLYEFHISNNGAGETGKVSISLPNVTWMSLLSPDTVANIAPQDTITVLVNLAPTTDVPLNAPISGNISVNCANGNGVQVPYQFEVVSEETGDLKVDVIDEYTYFTEAKPHVKNAHVVVRHPFSGKILAEGFTDSTGVFRADNLPEGSYKMTVEVEKHEGYQNTIIIDPGRVNEQSIFLSFQAISYTWEVVPTLIEDKYEVNLVMQFETNVPVPVVTIEMPKDMPQLVNNDTYAFLVTLTNKGLITAKDVSLELPQNDPEYEFVTNYNTMDLLAQQAIQIPVVMKRRDAQKSATSVTTTGPCTDYVGTVYGWECGKDGHWNRTNTGIVYVGRTCPSEPGVPSLDWTYYGDPSWGGGSGVTYYSPSGYSSTVTTPTTGCSNCEIDLALALGGCLPVVGAGFNTVGCMKTLVGFSGMSWEFGFDALICVAGYIPVIGCPAGLIGAAKSCFKEFFLKSPQSTNGGTETIPPIIKQSLSDMQRFVDKNDALVGYMNEFMGGMDWRSKESFHDFIAYLDSNSVNNKPFTPQQVASIKSKMQGRDITASEIDVVVTRWNNTVAAYALGIYSPTVDHPGIIDNHLLEGYVAKEDSVEAYVVKRGYASVGDMYNDALATVKGEVEKSRNSVCSSVTIKISQQLVMTREAFEGTLTIYNGNKTTAIKEIKLNLEIKDENGIVSNDLFQIETKALDILTGIDGTGQLGPDQKGSATVLFIPEKGAAPTVPKFYSFGGTFSYLDPFTNVTVTKPLFPVTLEVDPSPDLYLHYFMQRDILGDDPLTVPIEPVVPAELVVMVQNNGYGAAQGVRIESAQPKIVENQKGLAINFALIGSNLNGKPHQLGLTNIDFGKIAPKTATIGEWWFTSDLLGHFISYEANVTHLDSRGNPDLSLISGATMHELIKSIDVYGEAEDGINDFLVNEIQDALEFPDVIYLSNGGTRDVYPAPSETTSGSIAAGNHEIELIVTPKKIGWNYIKFSDPGNGLYKIASVTREDGQVIPLSNVWQTSVTLPDGKEPVYENMMHFLDVFAANNSQKYTVRFTAKDQNPPAIVQFDNVPVAAAITPITSVNIVFNKPIDPSTFNYEDMTLRIQGGPDVMDNTVTVTQLDPVTFKVDLTTKSIENGFYVLTVQASQISDLTGTQGLVGKQATWTQFINVPAIREFIGLPGSNAGAPVDFIMIKFNLPIDQTTLVPERFTWKKDGIPVTGTVTLTPMDNEGLLFQLSGLSAFMAQDGKYSLTVDLPNIKSLAGKNGILPQSTEWNIDQTAPLVKTIIPSTDGGYDLQHRTAFNIKFNEPIKGFGLNSLELWKDGQKQPLSQLDFTRKNDSSYLVTQFRLLTYSEGNYVLKIKMQDITDMAGNTSTDTVKYNWTVYRVIPKAITNLHITPDMGYSDTDNITATRSLFVNMTVNQANTRIKIYQTDKVNPILLADTSNVGTGPLTLPVNFTYSGNLTLQAYCIDSYTNQAITEIPVTIDDADLVCTWKNVPLIVLTTQPDSLQMEFSDKLFNDTKLKENLSFERNGKSIGTENLTLKKSSDKVYTIKGMNLAGTPQGTYSLSVDLTKFSKYNSGKQGISFSKTQWSVGGENLAPVANAGTDQIVDEWQLVNLDGTLSTDPNSDQLTYKWTAPDGITLSSTAVANPSFYAPVANQEIQYTFILVVNDGLVNSDPVQVKVTVRNSSEVSIPNHENSLIRIYPNPTTGILNIEAAKGTGIKTEISVINPFGSEVYRKEIIDASKFQLDLSNQANGVYLLRIRNNNQQSIKKIVLMKK